MNMYDEIGKIKEQIINKYGPEKIILFGSYAKGTATEKSDIDLCIVMDAADKREILTDMYINIESRKPFDLILYSLNEWESCVNDKGSFAHIIDRRGVVLYG